MNTLQIKPKQMPFSKYQKTNVLTRLHNETQKSNHIQQHAAIITKNTKRPVFITHNTERSKYTLSGHGIINCSMHAEMAVLGKLLRCSLKRRKKKYCVL